jgi:hypothetical protein
VKFREEAKKIAKEIMDLSKRLGINTQDKTRRVSVERIIQKLENLNL